jgi:hypothetical protein
MFVPGIKPLISIASFSFKNSLWIVCIYLYVKMKRYTIFEGTLREFIAWPIVKTGIVAARDMSIIIIVLDFSVKKKQKIIPCLVSSRPAIPYITSPFILNGRKSHNIKIKILTMSRRNKTLFKGSLANTRRQTAIVSAGASAFKLPETDIITEKRKAMSNLILGSIL